jgi:hypothetical protein
VYVEHCYENVINLIQYAVQFKSGGILIRMTDSGAVGVLLAAFFLVTGSNWRHYLFRLNNKENLPRIMAK